MLKFRDGCLRDLEVPGFCYDTQFYVGKPFKIQIISIFVSETKILASDENLPALQFFG